MINIIRIKNAIFYAYHGALQEEQNIGGKFEADVDIYTDFSNAARTDDLHKTVNYDEVYKFINKIVHEKKYYLIETLSITIAENLLEKFSEIQKVAVRVRKNNVPVGGLIDCVEAEVIKSRDE
ncbi:MAG: dihydroneopterin aldolase [Melioribacteraceae bacterium]|nr:dihydroneopterin aldolase [Melioribacteraceae bacterium]MCF8353968.1 dihydroneopterin aldolase [Melioribacteraceae bacterium]MCF8393696.1 dihydroneopterin aldolase [Melioribacteraceae bacterium]MCF8419562.1 dihydroneopterin aldolase [Melioribacteraceae bacterium]